jgi:hypothetical protein
VNVGLNGIQGYQHSANAEQTVEAWTIRQEKTRENAAQQGAGADRADSRVKTAELLHLQVS